MPQLFPDDQKRVDEFISSNVNDIERKPFRPWLLLLIIVGVLGALTVVSFVVALSHGVV